MFLSTVAPVLKSLVTSLALEPADAAALVPAAQALWLNEQRPFVNPGLAAEILLRVTDVHEVTNHAFRDRFETPNFNRYIHGMKEFTLSLQVRAYNELPETVWALEYADRICTRLDRVSSSSVLSLVNTCLVSIGSIQDIGDVIIDDRSVNVANVDIVFRAGFTDGPEALDWFERIALTSNFTAQTVLPAGAQVTALIIP